MFKTPQLSTDLPINADIAFTDAKGRHKPRLQKKQLKLVAKAAPLLEKILEPDEEIHFVTFGCSPYSLTEFMTTGWIIQYMKRCLLVVTDRRLLHLPTTHKFAHKHSISQILFEDVSELEVRSFIGSKLTVFYRDDSKETFTALPGWAAKKLKSLLANRGSQGRDLMANARQFLCPECTEPLAATSNDCSDCGMTFKSKQRALKLSLMYPGGGYFYTGHPWFGIGDAIVESMIILGIIGSLFLALGPDGDSTLMIVAAFYVVILVIEKLITVYHAQHYVAERIPADPNFSV